jgi:GTPase SAR1 family protein
VANLNDLRNRLSQSANSDSDKAASSKQETSILKDLNSQSPNQNKENAISNEEKVKWLSWFRGLGDNLEKKFNIWQELQLEYEQLEKLLMTEKFNKLEMSSARVELDKASDKLNYQKPYRVVVIGESGAGKSSIINAILKRKLLISDVGKAITGTATYIYPKAEDVTSPVVKIVKREHDDFVKLLNRLFIRYSNVKLLDILKKIEPNIILQKLEQQQSDLFYKLETSIPDETLRKRFLKEIKDIASTWERLNRGEISIPSELPLSEEEKLKNLLTEYSDTNKEGSSKRVIPGIKFVEYKLPISESSETDTQALRNVVFIDAPGAGARTLRHLDILQQEVKTADAVILVLNTTRADAENAESMAYLLQNDLLQEYEQADRSRFSNKVFLVANKIDELRGNVDGRKLLNDAVKEISEIIDQRYEQKYGKQSENRRYFETIAWFSLLCNLKKKQGSNPLSEDVESRYKSFAQLFNRDPNTVTPDELNELSEVPQFSYHLNKFLCEQRIDLMLEEARSHLRHAKDKMWTQCQKILLENGLEVHKGRFNSAKETQNRQQQKICEQILEQNLRELLETNQALTNAMDNWQKSSQYQLALTTRIETIFSETKEIIKSYITELVNSKAKLVRKSRSDLDGKYYTEILVKALLLEVEHRFQEVVEDKVGQLANYYLEQFESEIKTQGIEKILHEKSYEQDYVAEINPVEYTRKVQARIRSDYESICRWVLMYELVKMPIILSADDSEDERRDRTIVEGAFEKIVPGLAGLVGLAGIELVQNVAIRMVPPPLQEFVDVISNAAKDATKEYNDTQMQQGVSITEQSSLLASSSSETKSEQIVSFIDKKIVEEYRSELLDIYHLVGKINECIDQEDFSKASNLIERQFAFRYSLAISTALLFLDRLFFYERGKYRLEFERISRKLIDQHLAYVRTGNQNIQNILIQKYSFKTEAVEQALDFLQALEQLSNSEVVKSAEVNL